MSSSDPDCRGLWQCRMCDIAPLRNKQLFHLHLSRYHPAQPAHGTPVEGFEKTIVETVDNADDVQAAATNVHFPINEQDLDCASLSNAEYQFLESSLFNKELHQEVQDYYNLFNDRAEPIQKYNGTPHPPYETLQFTERAFIQHCLRERLSQSGCESMFQLLQKCRPAAADNTFENVNGFTAYVQAFRNELVRKQGWKSAVLETQIGINRSGTFRNITDLLQHVLQDACEESICEPLKEYSDTGRCYSHPMNSKGVEDLHEALPQGMKRVYFSLYCDGTTLSKSGSQTKTIVRVRFDNIKGHRNAWHELAICPTVPSKTIMSGGSVALSRLRAEVFHRFLFLVLKPAIESCTQELKINGILISLNLLMVVVDQPQERVLLGLKNVNSFRDCSLCVAQSKPIKNDLIAAEMDWIRASEAYCFWDPDSTDESNFRSAMHSGQSAATRDVQKSIVASLVASGRSLKNASATMKKSLARRYLANMSAHPYPPAIAAFPYMASGPGHLYKSVAFDLLHVMDLGVLRMIADHTHEVFQKPLYGAQGRKAELIRIVNQRFMDLPYGCAAPRRAIFLTNKGEVQSGMTGKVRRACVPFLWAVLLGVNPTVEPDNDILVQTALLMNEVYCEMKGMNLAPNRQVRTLENILQLQEKCTKLGRMIMETFGVPECTKLHRLMHHVKDHYLYFGDFFYGTTGENEAIHKDTKAAYGATNRQEHVTSHQLLQVRTGSEPFQEQAHHQKRRNIASETARECYRINLIGTVVVRDDKAQTRMLNEERLLDELVYEELRRSCTQASHVARALEQYEKQRGHQFTRVTRVQIQARFSWMEHMMKQTLFARSGAHPRMDFVAYESEEAQNGVAYGQIAFILRSDYAESEDAYVLLLREMKVCSAAYGNYNVSQRYGFIRLGFKVRYESRDYAMTTVPLSHVLHRALLVPDMHWMMKQHGVARRLNAEPKTFREKLEARFFLIPAQISTFGGFH